jgi:hypothetical protein
VSVINYCQIALHCDRGSAVAHLTAALVAFTAVAVLVHCYVCVVVTVVCFLIDLAIMSSR